MSCFKSLYYAAWSLSWKLASPIEYVLEDFSSFEDLPADLKDQLRNLSELAFEGVMQNTIVFTQKELKSLSTLCLLHSVQRFGSFGRKLFTCNFIHLAVQDLLAAYYISQLEPAKHSKQFEILLKGQTQVPCTPVLRWSDQAHQ